MHELGIITHVIKHIEEVAEEEQLEKVYSVTLEIGEVTGVILDIFQSCWKWSTDKVDILRGSALICEEVKAITICNNCGKQYETLAHGKICPYCSDADTELLYGLEMNIKEIEAE